MRRLLSPLVACALMTACAAGPVPDAGPDPERISLTAPKWSSTPPPSPSPFLSPSTPPSAGGRPETVPPPQGRPAAVDSPLYAGPETKARCAFPVVVPRSWKSMRRYLAAVSRCMDRVWKREFERARMYYVTPKRVYVRHRVSDPRCGRMPAKGAAGTYCDETRTYFVLIGEAGLQPWAQAWFAEVVAHEYAHHVQYMANISDYEAEAYDDAITAKGEDLVVRRLELQAECLAGVALHAVRDELPPRREFRNLYGGTIAPKWVRDHGRLGTQLRWFERGLGSGRPGMCDTWSVPGRRVT